MTRTTAGPILLTALVVICIIASMAMPSLRAAGRTMNARARRQWTTFRQWTTLRQRVAIGIGLFCTFSVLVLMQWWLAQWLTYQVAATFPTKEHFWIAVVLGKWPPDSIPYSSRNFWSALAVGIAVLLNVGFYAALFDLWRRVKKGSAMRMQLTTGLHVRDEIAKREIYQSQTFKSFSQSDQEKLEALVEDVFRRTDAEWRKIFVSPKAVDEIILD
jgi:hypothetical protein